MRSDHGRPARFGLGRVSCGLGILGFFRHSHRVEHQANGLVGLYFSWRTMISTVNTYSPKAEPPGTPTSYQQLPVPV